MEALRRPELLEDVRVSHDEYVEAVRQTLERLGLGGDPERASEALALLRRLLRSL